MPEPFIAPVESRLIAEIRTKRGSAWVMIALECGHLLSCRKKDIVEQQLAIGKPLDCGKCGWMLSPKLYVGGNRSETFIRHILGPIGDGGDVRWMSWSLLDGGYVETGCCSTGRLSEWTIREATEEDLAKIIERQKRSASRFDSELVYEKDMERVYAESIADEGEKPEYVERLAGIRQRIAELEAQPPSDDETLAWLEETRSKRQARFETFRRDMDREMRLSFQRDLADIERRISELKENPYRKTRDAALFRFADSGSGHNLANFYSNVLHAMLIL